MPLNSFTTSSAYQAITSSLTSRLSNACSYPYSASKRALHLEIRRIMENAADEPLLENTHGFLKRCTDVFSIENLTNLAIASYPLIHFTVGFSSLALQVGCALLSLIALAITVSHFLFYNSEGISPCWTPHSMEWEEDAIELTDMLTPGSLFNNLNEAGSIKNTYEPVSVMA